MIDNRFLILLLAASLLTGCTCLVPPIDDRFAISEKEHRENLDRLYPPQSTRRRMIDRHRKPVSTHYLSGVDSTTNAWMRYSYDMAIFEHRKEPKRCDVFWQSRNVLGIWADYVFYDDNDMVIAAYRKFLD